MKGIVFNMLEYAITRAQGEAAWDEVLASAKIDGAYTSLGNYADDELGALVVAAAARLGLSPDDTVRWFARTATPLLAERYPQFFAPHRSLRTLLPSLNDLIHPEVRKTYPGAIAPDFRLVDRSDGAIEMSYSSPRKLCTFAHGLMEGAAERFNERVEIEQIACARHGAPACTFLVRFHGSM